jgi:hypothetical protein
VTVTGSSKVKPGTKYTATASSDGSAPITYELASEPAPPSGMTIKKTTGAIKYAVPASGVTTFSYAVVGTTRARTDCPSIVGAQVVDPAECGRLPGRHGDLYPGPRTFHSSARPMDSHWHQGPCMYRPPRLRRAQKPIRRRMCCCRLAWPLGSRSFRRSRWFW